MTFFNYVGDNVQTIYSVQNKNDCRTCGDYKKEVRGFFWHELIKNKGNAKSKAKKNKYRYCDIILSKFR